MNETENENMPKNDEPQQTSREFEIKDFELNILSSSDLIKKEFVDANNETNDSRVLDESSLSLENSEYEEEKDPIFAALAAPKLPELERENRARLQMQSPTRLFFYWSMKNNPLQVLRKTFGGNTGNYQLVAKLVNQTREREEFFPVEAEGNWWFDVEAASNYQAEIGFYAPNRPFIRVMFSNAVETPRKNPSSRAASDADWAVTASEFAEVLDVSGFTRDAFETALAGDDQTQAETATGNAFYQLIGERNTGFDSEEMRFALLALASGLSLEELRGHISETLFAVLQENIANLSAEKSLAALQENFDIFTDEITEEESELVEIGSAVFGASMVNFPKKLRKRFSTKTLLPKTLSPKTAAKFISKLSPVSSIKI
ncbi:MAG: DUF4912 domain-containing protein [Acidobacteriota bacterium]|nr:DUF4912 domain-containing protein [Acidobacteriota bacterium]